MSPKTRENVERLLRGCEAACPMLLPGDDGVRMAVVDARMVRQVLQAVLEEEDAVPTISRTWCKHCGTEMVNRGGLTGGWEIPDGTRCPVRSMHDPLPWAGAGSLQDLRERLSKANDELLDLRDRTSTRSNGSLSSEQNVARIDGKADGVRLALSYIEEIERTEQ